MVFSIIYDFRPRSGFNSGRLFPIIALVLGSLLFTVGTARSQGMALPTPPAPASLSLQAAIDRAMAASPKMQAAAAGIEAAEGSQRQADLYPNPQAMVGVENFAPAGSLNGVAVTETTVGVSQLIELGGKRDARRGVALAGRRSAETDVAIARLDLVRDVTVAYAGAVAAQQQLALATELEGAAKEVLNDVTRRVNAARDPLFQKSKAEVAYSNAAITRQTAESAHAAALQKLARFWGDITVAEPLSDPGPSSAQPMPLARYEAWLREAPDLDRYRKARVAREADLQLAQANAVPDVTANAGIRHFGGTSAVAFVAGISVPIPVFNQNQGEIARAGADLRRAAEEGRQAELERSQELVMAWSQWRAASSEATSIHERSLPEAERAYQQALAGYRVGAFQYLEVLDAQRTLFEQRSRYVEALARTRTARAETERLAPATPQIGGAQ